MLNRKSRKELKQRLNEDFERFNKEIWEYLQSHPEYLPMFEYHVQKESRIKSVRWGSQVFDAWMDGKLDWFMNHSLLEYDEKSM